MTLADDQPLRAATAEGSRPRPDPEPEGVTRKVEEDLQNLGTEAIEQLASGLNKAAITIQELGQNVSMRGAL